MTMTGLPRAGAISRPHDNKQNVQKMKGLQKKRVLTEKQFEDFRQKIQKFHSSHGKQNKRKNHKTPRAKTEHEPMQAGGKKVKQNWKNHSE